VSEFLAKVILAIPFVTVFASTFALTVIAGGWWAVLTWVAVGLFIVAYAWAEKHV